MNRNKNRNRMKTKALTLAVLTGMLSAACTVPQEKTSEDASINDSNTPLHLMQPEYKMPYGIPAIEEVKEHMDRVLRYLEECTPARIVDSKSGQEFTDYTALTPDATLHQGTFRLTSYEWGVTYSAMLAAAEATGDAAYRTYVTDRFRLFAATAPHFRTRMERQEEVDAQMRKMLKPGALDDAGAMCAAMIKMQIQDENLGLRPLIENYIDYIMNKEYRLADGTFARTRPFHNTVWLDDMFMGIPPIAWYSLIAGSEQPRYQAEAVRQVLQFAQRMWVPEKNLFRHGWVESMEDHPSFHWGRANGWALLTLCEVLDALPENYPQRDEIMNLYRNHVRGLAALQSGQGFWHQLLDRNDSYLETSATAIYAYCIAHGINKGWLDSTTYGPVALLAWNAVTTQIDGQGQVGGTCVGTGMAFDPAFYYHRPVHKMAAHGYGPVIWAGAEIINLLKNRHPKMNDSAVLFYRTEQKTDKPIFRENESAEVEW